MLYGFLTELPRLVTTIAGPYYEMDNSMGRS